jgi:hypothetical protein
MTTNTRSKTSPVSTLAEASNATQPSRPAPSGRPSDPSEPVSSRRNRPPSDWWERPPASAGAVHVSLTADRPGKSVALSCNGRFLPADVQGVAGGESRASGVLPMPGSARCGSDPGLQQALHEASVIRTGPPTRLERQHQATPRTRVLVLVGVIISIMAGGFGIANASSSSEDDVRSYLVRPGDSFWSIARSVRSTGDVRPLVAELIEAHGSSSLRVGDHLEVPSV